MEKTIKAFKIFSHEWKCKGFQFKVGETYTFDGEIKICEKGFHACLKLEDCFKYYPSVSWNHIAEVEILGKTQTHSEDSKIVTDKIKIVKEIEWEKIKNDVYGGNHVSGGNYVYGGNDVHGEEVRVRKPVWK